MKKEAEYLIWEAASLPKTCILTQLKGIEKTYRLVDGVPLVDEIGDAASLSMDPDFRKDTLLADNLINPYRLIVVSEPLAKSLMERKLKEVEFLPISILDLEENRVPESYFIVHPVRHVDCLDKEKSGAEPDIIDPEIVGSVERLIIDEEKVDHERELFRPFPLLAVVLVRRELAQALDQEGFSGLQWTEPTDYIFI